MKAVLLRTGSTPGHSLPVAGSTRASLSCQDSVSGSFFPDQKPAASSPRISLHLEIARRRDTPIRRTSSESDIIRSATSAPTGVYRRSGVGSRSFARGIPEDEIASEDIDAGNVGIRLERWISQEEVGLTGDGYGKGKNSGGGRGGRGDGNNGEDKSKIGEYYKQMLRSNPNDSLLLRNYAKFLHEVEGDMEKAEEYYGRAILASPGDGEVLSLYGKLIWETHLDGDRAKSYFDQAVSASPDDCMVLGSYAHFMWEADEDEDNEEINLKAPASPPPAMVAAF